MHPLLQQLTGGDRRSIGASNAVAAQVLAAPELLAVLFQGMRSDDPLLRMRCADAAEKVTAQQPDWLLPYKALLLGELLEVAQAEVRWHVVPMLVRLPLTDAEVATVYARLLAFCNARSSILKTLSMQALADLALQHPHLLADTLRHLRELTVTGTPAMRARGRMLLASLSKVTPISTG